MSAATTATGQPGATPSERWASQLADWAIPAQILDAAPRDPYVFNRTAITKPAVPPLTSPTGQAVLERLAEGEPILDVGCGAGRTSGAFTDTYTVIGVEPRQTLADLARRRGLTVHDGRWPESAAAVDPAPIVLSTHVMYDVADAVPFLAAMHGHATRRVVLELTRRHPWVPVGPLYRLVHDIDRPGGPTTDLLAQVVTEATGVTPSSHQWTRHGSIYDDLDTLVDQQRRMLCIDSTHPRDDDLFQAVRDDVTLLPGGRVQLPPVDQTTLWWDVDVD